MSNNHTISNNHRMYKMLIADDDKGNLNYLRMVFRGDYIVLLTRDSNEALEELFKPENNDIAIIIADKKMPGASGIDFLKECKKKFSRAIRVMITAFPDINDVEVLINEVKVNMLFYKPLTDGNIKSLKRGLKEALDEYELNILKDHLLNEFKKEQESKKRN